MSVTYVALMTWRGGCFVAISVGVDYGEEVQSGQEFVLSTQDKAIHGNGGYDG
jgi:hypothetical protein